MHQRKHPGEDDERRLKAMCGARPYLQAVGDSVELFLAVDTQVRALGQVLAQQAVRVLAGAALPRAVRVAEVHRDARSSRQVLVACQFLALVVGQTLAHWLGNRIQLLRETGQRRCCGGIVHLGQQHQAAQAFDEYADR